MRLQDACQHFLSKVYMCYLDFSQMAYTKHDVTGSHQFGFYVFFLKNALRLHSIRESLSHSQFPQVTSFNQFTVCIFSVVGYNTFLCRSIRRTIQLQVTHSVLLHSTKAFKQMFICVSSLQQIIQRAVSSTFLDCSLIIIVVMRSFRIGVEA